MDLTPAQNTHVQGSVGHFSDFHAPRVVFDFQSVNMIMHSKNVLIMEILCKFKMERVDVKSWFGHFDGW